ncbi:MurR/RpiR family transcriptional regulator [Paenisporosarcina antarctica]|uniref:MurR/RpiR family transcriptional regulator n=1 Tax=Paenisporosarcina antarctica TaxID=417367 RepID=A0A4P7A1Y1_9BACL|nr:MurR/RpiR family transcriptional regulator [Paenisporosarcina antarctica]QBP41926.1 MurR/RpiR family transcriptional regulator [Paenisporosarcina antarctica]
MNIKELIHQYFHKLSKSQKKVASYVMDYPGKIALASAQEIGATIGVSETTVIRFCYSLELSGYAELQKIIREQLLSQQSSLASYQKAKLELEQEPQFFAKVMEQDRVNIAVTMNQIPEEGYETAINRLAKAEKVYILGLRSSFAAANWLSYTLGLVRADVQLIRPESEDVLQTLSRMDDKSVVIVISFHRYVKETIQIAKLAYTQQAFIIGITDSLLAPIHPYSQLMFPIYSTNKSPLDATAALFSLMNAIVAGLSVKEKDNFKLRQERYEALNSDFLFAEGD